MNAPSPELDPILRPFLRGGEREAQQHLDRLAKELQPVLRGVIARKLQPVPGGAETVEDLVGEATLLVLSRLRELRENGAVEPVTSLRGFAAVTASRVCDSHFRRRFPLRHRLRNRVLYLLGGHGNQTGFALWTTPAGARACGYRQWEGREPGDAARRRRLVDRPQRVVEEALPREDPVRMNPGELLAALFDWVGGPVELDELVRSLAELWGVRDPTPVTAGPADDDRPEPYLEAADPRVRVAEQAEQRAFLQAVWEEVEQLPPRQATALLLNLRDAEGKGVLGLLPVFGIAGIRRMAEVMEMAPERLAELWSELPLEDAVIAELLQCTRQQVINLRKVARERLKRRLRAFEDS